MNYEEEKIKQFEAKDILNLEELVFLQTLRKKREKPERKKIWKIDEQNLGLFEG